MTKKYCFGKPEHFDANKMKSKWKKNWQREYKVSKTAKVKYSTFQITKFIDISDGVEMYFLSTSPKRTCGTGHATFRRAVKFANKGYYII